MRALCAVCFQGEKGFGFDPSLKGLSGPRRYFCSRGHQLLWTRRGVVTDWTDKENEILFEGIKAGGAYLDDLGKTDLGVLSKEELITFAQCLLKTVTEERLRDVDELNDEIPF